MLSKIEENVDEAVTHLSWGREGVCVVAIAPDAPTSPPRAIQRSCRTAVQAIQAAPQLVSGISFHDEVNMIGLDGEVHDAKAAAAREAKCLNQRCERRLRSERFQRLRRPQRDVDGMARIVLRSRSVRYVRARLRSLASCAISRAAPRARWRKRELFWRPPCHLDSAAFFGGAPSRLRDARSPQGVAPAKCCAVLIRHPSAHGSSGRRAATVTRWAPRGPDQVTFST